MYFEERSLNSPVNYEFKDLNKNGIVETLKCNRCYKTLTSGYHANIYHEWTEYGTHYYIFEYKDFGIVCKYCEDWLPRLDAQCKFCYTYFDSGGQLFRHLRAFPQHQINKTEHQSETKEDTLTESEEIK